MNCCRIHNRHRFRSQNPSMIYSKHFKSVFQTRLSVDRLIRKRASLLCWFMKKPL